MKLDLLARWHRAGARAVTASLLLAGSCVAAEPATDADTDVGALAAGAQAAAAELGRELKARLVGAMGSGGPAAAVRVCAEDAGDIARRVSARTGFEVGRTALKLRNATNAPDAWERAQLEAFVAAIADGAAAEQLVSAQLVRNQRGDEFRWARPILLEAPCATCHGEAVDPALLRQIRQRYPHDAATGFAVGDVRGMFTVRKRLTEPRAR
jgi:hypothetical protein